MKQPPGNQSELDSGVSSHSQASCRPFWSSGRVWLIVFLLVVAVTTVIRIRLLNLPLQRDEGEYAYTGQLMLEGVFPYQQVYTMKWPGTHAAYALIMAIFGQTAAGIHAGLILITVASAVLMFLLAKRLYGDAGAAVAAGTYALLSASPAADGLAAHATHFVVLPALGGMLLLLNPNGIITRTRIFFGGLLFGLSALMKQPGMALGVFAVIWFVGGEISAPGWQWRRLAVRLACWAAGGLLPFLLIGFFLLCSGAFGRFWFWTVDYARAYGSFFSPVDGMTYLLDTTGKLFRAAPGLWGLAALGFLLLLADRSLRHSRSFVLGFLLFSFLAVCPGWYFRPHYFLLVTPAAGLLAGAAMQSVDGWMARLRMPVFQTAVPLLLFAGPALWSLFESRSIFFQLTPPEACRAIYPANPFPEMAEVARYLRSQCPPNARIAVLGSEPEIFFNSQRRSATGYIYTYPLMEPQPFALMMQKEMIREIEAANPDYVVYVRYQLSWLQSPNSPLLIFDWFERYQREHLQMVVWMETRSTGQTAYHWTIPPGTFAPDSDNWLAIYKKQTAAPGLQPLEVK